VRLSEGDWLRLLANPESFVVSVSYEDKFGPLGVIAVVAGKQASNRLEVTTWVMSCRAFSRRIEHHTLEYLCRISGAKNISLAFQPTERNQALQEFLTSIDFAANGANQGILFMEKAACAGEGLPHRVSVIEESLGQGDTSSLRTTVSGVER
jgi:predicted enzyme involved in methoxymalonyl-ACP biosynthesis